MPQFFTFNHLLLSQRGIVLSTLPSIHQCSPTSPNIISFTNKIFKYLNIIYQEVRCDSDLSPLTPLVSVHSYKVGLLNYH